MHTWVHGLRNNTEYRYLMAPRSRNYVPIFCTTRKEFTVQANFGMWAHFSVFVTTSPRSTNSVHIRKSTGTLRTRHEASLSIIEPAFLRLATVHRASVIAHLCIVPIRPRAQLGPERWEEATTRTEDKAESCWKPTDKGVGSQGLDVAWNKRSRLLLRSLL